MGPPASNPYLDAYRACGGNLRHRDGMVRRFSWAIPDEEALELLCALGPIVEIGAGTGYWGRLLLDRGADVVCFDIQPTAFGTNRWHDKHPPFMDVLYGDASSALTLPRRALFLCWPPLGESLAIDALLLYEGNHVAFIGEPGVTATDAFYAYLRTEFKLQFTSTIPNWGKRHDYLSVWSRRVKRTDEPKYKKGRILSLHEAMTRMPDLYDWLRDRPVRAERYLPGGRTFRATLAEDGYYFALLLA